MARIEVPVNSNNPEEGTVLITTLFNNEPLIGVLNLNPPPNLEEEDKEKKED